MYRAEPQVVLHVLAILHITLQTKIFAYSQNIVYSLSHSPYPADYHFVFNFCDSFVTGDVF
jgi:hypothetical protein